MNMRALIFQDTQNTLNPEAISSCAAVSAIVINTINSIDKFTDDKTNCVSDEESGAIEFRFGQIPSHDASLLLDSMVLGLEQIEDSNEYEPYIDIIFKEV